MKSNKPKKPKEDHYVNNKELVDEILKYKEAKAKADKTGDPIPQMSERLGEMILLIARRLATSHNFSGYTYKEEMISDGIENCMMYITNFDPAKSKNAFSYISQIFFFAFIRRIGREKKQSYIKLRAMEREGIYGFFPDLDRDKWEKSKKIDTYKDSLGLSEADETRFDSKIKRPRASTRKKTGVEKCMEDD